MVVLTKGDLLLVNYVGGVHNVVNAVCEVVGLGEWGGYKIKAPTKEQGNGSGNMKDWNLPFPSQYLKRYYPPLKVGDTVKIVGYMFAYTQPDLLHHPDVPDQRGVTGKITSIKDNKYRIGGWWYPRQSLSTNMNALREDDLPPGTKMPFVCTGVFAVPGQEEVAIKPPPKYKCINPRNGLSPRGGGET